MSTKAGKPIIYQLVVRYFSNLKLVNKLNGTIAENGCGKFADINQSALSEIKEFGCTHIWLTGCIRQATLTAYPELGLEADDPDIVKGRAGSMYAIKDYFDVCPDYATAPKMRMAEFQALISRIHQADLKVILDFVPNHVARSYNSTVNPQENLGSTDDASQFFSADNNFFYLVHPPKQKLQLTHPTHWQPEGCVFDGCFIGEDGENGRTPKVTGNNIASSSPPVDSWYEVIKLNYGFNFVNGEANYSPTPKTWKHMDRILKYWQDKGIDGFRCDFAHYVPAPAWRYLIDNAREVSRNPAALFIAEAYPWVGSGDPITDKESLIDAGFDAVYQGEAYRLLKNIYHQSSSLDDYDREMTSASEKKRLHSMTYIENHDEVRVAAPLELSGFGSANANYQLAPLQYLYGPGPVLILNGQEVGEPGAGNKGFSGIDGRTSIFDYWCMPEFAKWVNEHRYDGAKLTAEQKALRKFLGDLLELCQDPAICSSGYWGLRYFNRRSRFDDCPDDLYSFARFQPHSSRIIIVVANFSGNQVSPGKIRIPAELATAAHLNQELTVRLLLNAAGKCNTKIEESSRDNLIETGFEVLLPEQSSQVYCID